MWSLWFVPFVIGLLAVGATVSGVLFVTISHFSRSEHRHRNAAIAASLPLGCAALPIVTMILLAMLGTSLQESDADLYEEMFGYRPGISEDRMLSDDFGSGMSREIYMRIEPTTAERQRLLRIPGLTRSPMSIDQFAARGTQNGFSWWISTDIGRRHWFDYCRSARIYEAHGFRGWVEFRIAECTDDGSDFPRPAGTGMIYIVASRRPW